MRQLTNLETFARSIGGPFSARGYPHSREGSRSDRSAANIPNDSVGISLVIVYFRFADFPFQSYSESALGFASSKVESFNPNVASE